LDNSAIRPLPAQVAVYSEQWRPVAAIRRILLRMKSWLNYLI
jgi:hypothetical protein